MPAPKLFFTGSSPSAHGKCQSIMNPNTCFRVHFPVRQFAVLWCAAVAAFIYASPMLAESAQDETLTFNLGVEPRTLDPHVANGVPEAHVILNLVEGLTRTDEKGRPVPAMADHWEVSEDMRTYTFHLRPAVWSNGEPVTADDFVYGWRRCLAPETAGEYAYQLFFLQGAEEYNSGKVKDPASVGVRAITTGTLEARLKAPTPFFLSALAHYAYSPLKESWVRAHPKWTSNPSEYLCNGPFVFSEWRHSDRLVLTRNPRYYNASSVKLGTVVMTMITNDSTALLQWEAGKIDLTDSVPLPDIPRLKKQGKYNTAPYLGIYYVAFQNTRKPFDNPKIRRAFSLAVNRKQITEAILRGGQPPAYAVVPPGIVTGAADFRSAGGDLFKEDVAEAKRLLAEAGYPEGKGFPRVKYLYNDNESHRVLAQALQNMWQTALGVQVELDVQEWKVYQQNRQNRIYQFARAGWIGDYLDPITFLDMFNSRAGNNDVAYRNAQFDALLEKGKETTATEARNAALHEAEKTLIGQDMAIAPIYFYVAQYLQKPHVKGVVRNPLGYLYFDRAYIER